MDKRLLETCEHKFEHGIERFAEMLFSGCVGQDAFTECLREQPDCYLQLLDLAERALRARRWFAKHAPCWCQPLPLVHYDEQEDILCSGDMPRHLVVYYSYSLRGLNFDYLKHPLFYDYARGVMAHPDCPNYLQGNPQLLAEFPPKPLPGLVDGIHWRPPNASRGVRSQTRFADDGRHELLG
jgi:hypothetical protein